MKLDNKAIKLSKLSEYRTPMMGLAIILIVFSHHTVFFPGTLHQINGGLQMLSQCGVDIFFLLSGLGCYYSLSGKSSVAFYKARCVKIMIPYIIIFVIWGIISIFALGESVQTYITKYNLISFFTEAVLNEWFIAAIIVTYAISPLLYKLLTNNRKFYVAVVAMVYVLIFMISTKYIHSVVLKTVVSIWVTRIPAFMVGMLAADAIRKSECSISLRCSHALIGFGLLCAAITLISFKLKIPNYWTINRILFLPMVIAILLLFAMLADLNKESHIVKVLSWLGSVTLEIYLLHEKILKVFSLIPIFGLNAIVYTCIINVAAIVITLLLAKGLHIVVGEIDKRL